MLGKSQTKYIQSLGHKKVRDEEGVYIAEGPKIVGELLASPSAQILKVFALQDWIKANNRLLSKAEIVEIDEQDLTKISQLTTPNKVLALLKKPQAPVSFTLKNQVSLVLDTIQDPGNLGTIIRIADWFGITQLVCSRDCADAYNPKVVQSTMGSIARVQLLYTDLTDWLGAQKHVPVYATVLDGEDISRAGRINEGLIIIGNESKGISEIILKCVDKKITIPRKGKAESLNAAVATGIVLSHLV